MHSHLRRSALVLAAAAAGLVGAPAAQAAIGVTDVTVSPSTTQAAAPSSFGLAFRLSDPAQQVKDLTIHLPPGLVGNPLAQPACPVAQFQSDGCPANTAVGTSQVNADPGNLTIDGTVYNLVAQAGEPARLGIVYRNPSIASLFVQSSVALRPEDGGLDSIIKDLPRQARVGGLLPSDTVVKGISLMLSNTFSSNPTSCEPALTRVDVTSYAAPTVVASGRASFTPTGCDKVPFAPRLSASIANLETGASPSLTTVITQAPGEAGIRSVAVTLPGGIGPNGDPPGTCERDQAAAGRCPAASVVGKAAVRSPLLKDEVAGNVYFVTALNELPTLRIELRGALEITLNAKVSFSPTGALVTTVSGIPDVPVSRFELSFAGGRRGGGVLSNTAALCSGTRTLSAAFTAQSGARTTTDVAPQLIGCPTAETGRRAPTASARITAGGTLVLTARAGSRRIRGLRATLARRPAARRGAATPGRVRLVGRVVSVGGLPAGGSSRVVLRVAGARGLRGTRATVVVRDAGGRATTLRVRVR